MVNLPVIDNQLSTRFDTELSIDGRLVGICRRVPNAKLSCGLLQSKPLEQQPVRFSFTRRKTFCQLCLFIIADIELSSVVRNRTGNSGPGG
jgi:hypothetical protein